MDSKSDELALAESGRTASQSMPDNRLANLGTLVF